VKNEVKVEEEDVMRRMKRTECKGGETAQETGRGGGKGGGGHFQICCLTIWGYANIRLLLSLSNSILLCAST